MNWRRILASAALGGWVLLIGGVLWLGPRDRNYTSPRNPISFQPSRGQAIVVLQFNKPDPVLTTHSLDCGSPDLMTYDMLLHSMKIWHGVLTSLNSSDFHRIVGANFRDDG